MLCIHALKFSIHWTEYITLPDLQRASKYFIFFSIYFSLDIIYYKLII